MTTEGTLSGFQEFFLQPIIKDRPNNGGVKYHFYILHIACFPPGLELAFDIPYIYTTPPMAVTVYLYAALCTCTHPDTQGLITSCLTFLTGCLFAAVAVRGCYRIVAAMLAGR